MTEVTSLLERIVDGGDLSEAETAALLTEMAEGALFPEQTGAILVALRMKGETAEEISGLATAMRRLALKPSLQDAGQIVDVVGTGGDGSGSLNLSTGSAILAAAAGARVVKHGNRAVSGRSGSADVLAALGLPMPLDAEAAAECLARNGFTFLFAPHFHPAMGRIAPVRRALGVRTVFNILGPLSNPAAPPFLVVGAFSAPVARKMAGSLSRMQGVQRAFVVHGAGGWDEPTPVGPFLCFDVRPGRVEETVRDPLDYGLQPCDPRELEGGEPDHNAHRLEAALAGDDLPSHRDALALGAALALEVMGEVSDVRAGLDRARSAIADGSATRVIEGLAHFGKVVG
ncbi:MAG TPA: anthranilate phosphoribosyltransferase [Acidimicrobiia bacterium]